MGNGVRNLMRLWILFGAIVIVAGLAFVLARLHPPKHIVMAAGPDGGAYAQTADDYRRILARDGITVIIRETAGSQENAQLLADGAVDAAILQGGIRVESSDVEAIGTIFFEPMFFLARTGLNASSNPAKWKNLRITAGQAGSGTAAVFDDFEKAVGLRPTDNTRLSLSYADAVAALTDDQVDIAVFVAPVDAPYLETLRNEAAVEYLELDYTEALSRRLTYANTVDIPAGAFSMDPVQPPEEHTLLALETRIAITPDVHPAIVNRLTMAALELHGKRGILADPHAFPSVEGADMPVNNSARNLILNGPSSWHDWLPYWMAAQVNRMFLLLLPFIFVVVPLLRLLPRAFAYVMRWRVWQHYPEIRQIEEELKQSPTLAQLEDFDARLEDLDKKLANLRLPPAYRNGQYDARLHIDLVKARVKALRTSAPQDPEAKVVPLNTGL